jgi:cohesin complex subunit SA-1/2
VALPLWIADYFFLFAWNFDELFLGILLNPHDGNRGSKTSKKDDDDSDDDDEVSVRPNLVNDNLSDDESTSSSDNSEAPKGKRKQSPKRIQVQYKQQKSKTTPKKTKSAAVAKSPNKARVLGALRSRTLDELETPDNSLTCAILAACAPTKKSKAKKQNYDGDQDSHDKADSARYPDVFIPTHYTPLLEPVVQQIIALYKQDANKAHVSLLNLVFRSVGGSTGSVLQPDMDLEGMEDDTWEQVVTSIVDDMRRTPPDCILICADPKGAVHAHDEKKHNAAQEEFRRIYDHFWYVLGTLALSDLTTNTTTTSTSSSLLSFDIELVRELVERMRELVGVGQPDLRAASSIASFQLAQACCDGTLALESRLITARRQWNAAKAAKTSTKEKEKALQRLVESLERSSSELQEIVQNVISGVFMRRYRDSNFNIRASSLAAMSKISLTRPDAFLKDTYLKYFGWMMSDKVASVRVAALQGLLTPFTRADEQAEMHENSIHPLQAINVGRMDKVVEKFLHRMCDCAVDVAVEVQEVAMKLLLALLKQGLLDEMEDISTWAKINLRALAENTTPRVRRDALYIVLEQLEPFDSKAPLHDPKNLNQSQKVHQIDAIASWVAHGLCDGNIPLDNIRVHLTDYVIQSLSKMPRHAHLVTDWTVMLLAIQQETQADRHDLKCQRSTITKQRVLLRMLVCAASLALGNGSGNEAKDNGSDDNGEGTLMDPDFLKVQSKLQIEMGPTPSGKKKSKNEASSMLHESLTVGLLKALPTLLPAYKGDAAILRSLTMLPKFLSKCTLTT